MRLALISDIHADFFPGPRRALVLEALADEVKALRPDVFVMAGDVGNGPNDLERHLAPLAVASHNLYVPGNHDVWRTPAQLREGRDSDGALALLAEHCARAGWHYLPGNPLHIDGWGFAGSLGWYDWSLARPDLGAPLAAYRAREWRGTINNDRNFVVWRGRPEDPEMAERFRLALERDLRWLGLTERGSGPPTVAVTHMLPFRELVQYKGAPGWDFFSAFMGSAALGEMYRRLPAVRAAFAGHTHTVQGFGRPDGFVAAVSPLGYYGSREFPRELGERIALFETKGRSLKRVG